MLKVANTSSDNIIHQKRTTQFSSNGERGQESKVRPSISRSSSNSKLKYSTTISRVPAKIRSAQQPVDDGSQKTPSRLARPVASAITDRVEQQADTTALLNSTPSQQVRGRPTSLALRVSKTSNRGAALKAPSSMSASKLPVNSSNEAQNYTGSSIKQQVKRKLINGKQQLGTSTGALNNSNKASVNSSQISRLSGLKNLVAVVHPQHLQCVNQTATAASMMAATANKLAPTTVSIRYENGKATSTDKDGNNNNNNSREKKKESKQDDSQIIRQLKTTTTTTGTTTINTLSYGNKQINNSRTEPSTSERLLMMPSSITQPITFTTSKAKLATAIKDSSKIEHGNHTNLLLSDAPSTIDASDDKIQQIKADKKLSDKHSLAQTYLSSQEEKQQPLITNCFNHHVGFKSTLTKSTHSDSSSSQRDNTNKKDAAMTINDHLLPKPMGQQVLALMMLDVGLLPAGTHYNEQQRFPPQKKSHVRLHEGTPIQQNIADDNKYNESSQFHDDNCLQQQQSVVQERDSVDRLNCSATSNQSCEQSNNYYSLETSAHNMLRLQVRKPNEDNGENLRSISLPASPSMKVRDHPKASRTCAPKADNANLRISRAPSSTQNLPHQAAYGNYSATMTKLPSATSRLLQASYDQLLSLYGANNQEAHSLTSSSCSSLNQCPPLLALSNQLSSFKLDELLTKTTGSGTDSHSGNENQLKKTNAKQEDIDWFYHSLDQVALVEKQHELLLANDSTTLHQKKHHLSSKINNARSCNQPPKEIARQESEWIEDEQVSKSATSISKSTTNSDTDELVRGDDGSPDYQLRRQQQIRSHSISGQDFHLNGQYQRLKQSLYIQQNITDCYQNYSVQGGNQMQQVPSTYQQHQPLDRSPSPLSVSSQINYGSSNRDNPMKYERQSKNQVHTSLECLNASHLDYQQYQAHKLQLQHHQQQQQWQQQQLHHQNQQQQLHHQNHQQQQQQQQQLHHQNQHYAASYVLVPPPVNTVINQNGDQDLAAAAMGIPSQQYHSEATSNVVPSNRTMKSNNQTQSLINRAMAQVSQSPVRRLGSNGVGSSSNVLGHLSSLHHPMRAGHSSLSLASPSFIIEDKLQNEIRKLEGELKSEKEKNEALNSQLNINSSLMAAFEQSLTTLNTRLRQLTTLNEKKDDDIEELKEQLRFLRIKSTGEKSDNSTQKAFRNSETRGDRDTTSESIIEDLKRQLIEKDRLLTDTRLEALSAAHQLEQLESKLSGENSLMVNEDELDEGVMVVNHSPSDSEAITDSAHFSEITSQFTNSKHHYNEENFDDNVGYQANNGNMLNGTTEREAVEVDKSSNHSCDPSTESRDREDAPILNESNSQIFLKPNSRSMCRLMDSLLVTSTSS